jgi:hypothetical protein
MDSSAILLGEKIGVCKSKIVKKTFLRNSERSERRQGETTIAQNPNFET